jgi:beta-glucosidase
VTAEADAQVDQVSTALRALTLEEKVDLLTGADFWSTRPLEKIGLRRMVLSDGPSGVRGEVWDERDPSLNLPSGTALACSWDPDVAYRFGAVAAGEARRKGVGVVLGPTVNLHRSPLGGRHFECFSEDPVLTGELAAAYVNGLQNSGVGACPKHYVANDSETDRFTVDVRVGDRALHELYLLPFETVVARARPWLVMSSYNSVNGVTLTENQLLETPLNSEWGFDGVVVSDWTAVRSLAAAAAAQDLAMPGPDGPWGQALVAAVRSGAVDEALVDRKVTRLLRLAERVGALGDTPPALVAQGEDGPGFTREAAIEGTVLLSNNGELPWKASTLTSVAVIGANAAQARTQGGGSATVLPEYIVSPLAGLRAALPGIDVSYSIGAIVHDGLAELPLEQMTNPVTGTPGLRVSFRDADGREIFTEDRRASALVWIGGDAPIERAATLELGVTWTPAETGRVKIGFASVGSGRVFVDGKKIVDATLVPVGTDLGAAFLSPPAATATIGVQAGVSVELRLQYVRPNDSGPLTGVASLQLGTAPDQTDDDVLIAEAVTAARAADVALVVVGTTAAMESEGYDRSTLRLPGRQDDLVAAVAAVNPHTVVLVNSGAPVLMPWRHDVAAVLLGWFGGQEFGSAIAAVLLGEAEPGGRLTTTWPDREEDVPVLSTTPVEGGLTYSEGVHIGYRAWLRSGATPAYWFGSGQGYTTFDLLDAQVDADGAVPAGSTVPVVVTLVNTGDRAGKQVVQIYAEKEDSTVDRPVRWLVGSAPVRLQAGEQRSVTVAVPTRLLAHWDSGWCHEPGLYRLRVGTSAVDLPLTVALTLGGVA